MLRVDVERTSEKDRFAPHTLVAAGAPTVAAACGPGGACVDVACLGSNAAPAISEVTDSIPVDAGRCDWTTAAPAGAA